MHSLTVVSVSLTVVSVSLAIVGLSLAIFLITITQDNNHLNTKQYLRLP